VGRLRSKTNRAGLTVNGVLLGDAPITLIDGTPPEAGTQIEDLWFIWDDPAFPTGVVYPNGSVDVDEPTEP
jgi:hypothetical protein